MNRRKQAQRKWKRWAQKCSCFRSGNEATDPDDQHPVKQVVNPLNTSGTIVDPNDDGEGVGDTTNTTQDNNKSKDGQTICASVKDRDEITLNAVNAQLESKGDCKVVGDTTNATESDKKAKDEYTPCALMRDEDEVSSGVVDIEVESKGDGDMATLNKDEVGVFVNATDTNQMLNRDRKSITTTNEDDEKDETWSTSSSEPTLWEKALRRIEDTEKDEEIIANIKNFEHEVAKETSQGGVKTSATAIAWRLSKVDRTVEKDENQWDTKFKCKVRQLFRHVFTILQHAVPIGDTLVSIDPVHAALPWAAVRLVLMMLDAKNKLETAMAIGLAQVTKLLEEAIVQAYIDSLLFLGFAAHQIQGERGFLAILKLDTVESHAEKLLNVENALAKAADNCEKYRSRQIQTTGEKVLQLTRKTYKAAENMRVTLDEIQKQCFISKLHPINTAKFEAYDEPRCHEKTRVELLQKIRKWVDDPDGETIFWLEGMAGTGKSTISRTVCQMFHDTGELGASFFFKRNSGERDKPVYFFQTIAAQLCYKLPHFAQGLMENLKDNDVSERVIDQFKALILDPLRNSKSEVKGRSTIVVVVDALDECGKQYRDFAEIVDCISDMRSLQSPFDFRFFLTSRSECYAQYTLLTNKTGGRAVATDHRAFVLHEIPVDVVKTDISAYLASELTKVGGLYNNIASQQDSDLLEDWPSKDDLEKLVGMATPLFIFAATVCRLLESLVLKGLGFERPDRELTKILERPTANSNDKLSATCILVLERIISSQDIGEEKKKEIKEDFQGIIGPIVLLDKPLSVASLAKLLEVEKFKVNKMIQSLRSVIRVPPRSEPSFLITIFHLSFREFLVTKNTENRGVPEEFYIDMKAINEMLANKCLDLLTKKDILKDDMCGLKIFGKQRKDISEKTVE